MQLIEPAAISRQGPALARGATPRLPGLDLEMDDRVVAQRVPHALGPDGTPSQGHHPTAAGPLEHGQHRLLLALTEGRLAFAVEECLDRLAERRLELAVGVQRGHAQLGGHRARGARLAGAHEADEHQRAAAGGGRDPLGGVLGQRLHPIRSS